MCAGSRKWVKSSATRLYFPFAASSYGAMEPPSNYSVRLRAVGTKRCSKPSATTSRVRPFTRATYSTFPLLCTTRGRCLMTMLYLIFSSTGSDSSPVVFPVSSRLRVYKRRAMNSFRTLLIELGYNPVFTSTDYSDGSPAALGNYIARCMIGYGLQDGSNESSGHVGTAYRPVNLPLHPSDPGKPDLLDSNRWQSLSL